MPVAADHPKRAPDRPQSKAAPEAAELDSTDSREAYFGHHHVTEIRSTPGPFDLKLDELWAYRDLIWLLVRRDFVSVYKQTILGPAWHVIQPLLTTLMFTLVFGRIARMPVGGAPPFLFFLSGTVLWTYFAAVTTNTSHTFVRNANLFGKVYFPRLAVPVALLFSKLVAFAIQFALLLFCIGMYWLRGKPVVLNAWAFATPFLVVMLGALALGFGVIVSALTTRYRDLTVMVSFGVQLLMFASPIVYPLSALGEKWRFWASLNPIAPVVEAFRYAFLGVGHVDPRMLVYSAAVIGAVVVFGVSLFNRVERTFMDTV
jgi:lipopolysaccharide transport system permease protein